MEKMLRWRETLHESDACRARVASKVWHSLGMCVNMLGHVCGLKLPNNNANEGSE